MFALFVAACIAIHARSHSRLDTLGLGLGQIRYELAFTQGCALIAYRYDYRGVDERGVYWTSYPAQPLYRFAEEFDRFWYDFAAEAYAEHYRDGGVLSGYKATMPIPVFSVLYLLVAGASFRLATCLRNRLLKSGTPFASVARCAMLH